MYRCRTCHNVEAAQNYCVFRNNLSSNSGETAGVTTDVGTDPTVSAASYCPNEVKCSWYSSYPKPVSCVRAAVKWKVCSFRVNKEHKIPKCRCIMFVLHVVPSINNLQGGLFP